MFAPLEDISLACIIQKGNSVTDTGWIFDSGATDTMTNDKKDFVSFSNTKKSHVQTANGDLIVVEGAGTVEISPSLRIHNCLYVPTLSQKLLSISQVTKELNCSMITFPNFCLLQDIRTRRTIGRGTERHGLYHVDGMAQRGCVMLTHGSAQREAWLWHRRLGHPSPSYFKTLFPKFSSLSCETCVLAKSHRQSFKPSNTRMQTIFSLIHSDVWGPAPVNGDHGFKYFVTFVDDCTRMTWIYFLRHKSEVVDKFISFFNMIQTQFQSKIKILRSDNGREFVNGTMVEFCREHGLIHQTSCPYTPE